MKQTDQAWLEWVVATCLLWGTSAATAYQVAAKFAEALDDSEDDES